MSFPPAGGKPDEDLKPVFQQCRLLGIVLRACLDAGLKTSLRCPRRIQRIHDGYTAHQHYSIGFRTCHWAKTVLFTQTVHKRSWSGEVEVAVAPGRLPNGDGVVDQLDQCPTPIALLAWIQMAAAEKSQH